MRLSNPKTLRSLLNWVTSKILLTLIALVLLISAQVSQAYNLDGDYERHAELQRVLDEIMSTIPSTASEQPAASTYLVKVVYFIPKNRVAQPNAEQKLKDYILLCQEFYAKEMARNGYYKPGSTTEGQTFELETDENGEPIVHIVNGKYNDDYYRADMWGRILNEVLPVYPVNRACLFLMTECHKMNSDGTVSGGFFGGAQWSASGGWGGVGMLGSDTIWFLGRDKFYDNRPYHGLRIPEYDNIPMVQDVTFAWFLGTTVGSVASSFQGGIAHELGHAFGLPHCFVNDNNFAGDLMGNGHRGFRGNFGNFPGEWVRMHISQSDMLVKSRYFIPDSTLTDTYAPTQSAVITVEEKSPTGKRIHVKVTANDSGSGLWRSIALIDPPWSTIDSAPFNASGVADYYIDSAEVPQSGGLTAQSYNFEVFAIDNQGNRRINSYWVQVPGSMKQQVKINDKWYDLIHGAWYPSTSVRLSMDMTARETGITLYPEVELQPIGTPFTGTPNYINSTGYAYNGSPVTGYIEMDVPMGGYHWRYRLRTSTGVYSQWVTKGMDDPNELDFGVDTTPPSVPVVTDSGQYSSSKTSLTASWSASDDESGIVNYRVAVGTTPYDPGSGYVKSWTVFTSTSGTITGLNLVEGVRYYIYVKAMNPVQMFSVSGVSDGITVKTSSPQVVNIKQAKELEDGAYVTLENVVTTTGKSTLGDFFYVEQPDRSAGIRVSTENAGVLPDFEQGTPMTVTGIMSTVDGERVVTIPELTLGTGTTPIKPVGMNSRALGGGTDGLQHGVDGSVGLNNIGLLVRVFGKVTASEAGEFTITDGYGPVKVVLPPGVTVLTSERVMVTGISSCTQGTDGKLVRTIRVRGESDIKPL